MFLKTHAGNLPVQVNALVPNSMVWCGISLHSFPKNDGCFFQIACFESYANIGAL